MQTTQKVGKVIPWSYSSLQAFEQCPRRFQLTRIARVVKEAQSAQTLWGNEVHKALELALKGTNGLTPKFKMYQPIIDRLRASPGEKLAERNVALDAAFKPVDYWSPEAWVRAKFDVTIVKDKTGTLLDYKTGKPKEDYDQLNLFAAMLLAEKPQLERVKTGYLWLAHDKMDIAVVERENAPIIWQQFTARVKGLQKAADNGVFPPRPSGLCKEYCPVGKKNCEYCGRD